MKIIFFKSSTLPVTSLFNSYSAEILSEAGAPTEELSGVKTFSLVNPLSSSAYFTIETIREKVSDPSLILKIYNVVAETMGDEFERIFDIYFDYNLALNSIQYFNVRDIPKISDDVISPAITNVKYDCNLSNVNSIDTESNASQLLKALS